MEKLLEILKAEIDEDNIDQEIEITKAIIDNINKSDFDSDVIIEKAGFGKKDITKLRAVKKIVTRDGKTFLTTVYVKYDDLKTEVAHHKKEIDEKGHFESKYTIHDVKVGDEISITPKYKSKAVETIGKIKGIFHRKSTDELTLELQIPGLVSDTLSYFKVKDSEIKKLGSDDKEDLKEIKEKPSLSTKEMYDKGVSLGGSSDARLYGDKVIKKPRTDLPGRDGELQLAVEKAVDFFYTKINKELITGNIEAKKSEFKDGFLISNFIEGVTLNRSGIYSDSDLTERLKSSFVFDTLLANYDVIGADKDNILYEPSTNKIYKVDTGGSLFFRARGKRKTYTDVVSEIDTFRDASINPVTSKIYGSINDDEIAKQVARIKNNERFITDVFDTALLSIPEDLLSIEEKGKLLRTFKNRIKNLEERFLEKPKEEEKVEESTEDKGDYGSVVTKKFFEKFDKYEVDPSINPHLKSTIKQNILDYEKKYEDHYIKYAKENGLSIEQYKVKLQEYIEKIVNKDVKLFRATNSECLKSIIKDGRYKSQFEISKSHGCLDPNLRHRTEKAFFGFNKDADDSKRDNAKLRPIYGYPSNDTHGAHNMDGKVPPVYNNYTSSYGDMTIEMKDDLRKRTTFTVSDSLNEEDNFVANFIDLPHFTSIKVSSSWEKDPLKELISLEKSGKLDSKFGSYRGSYMELQYHGGVSTSDIKAVHVHFNKENKTKMDRQIKRAVELISKNEDVKLEIFD